MAIATQQLRERCITDCVDCVRTASRCVNECVSSDQAAQMAECVRLCLDCVDRVRRLYPVALARITLRRTRVRGVRGSLRRVRR